MATKLAERIAAAGEGRVRRVVMIGSRARGTARPESDLDLVVLVEIPREARPWGPAETIAERDRIQRRVGPPPLRTDLWVRTTDRFEEARRVPGGVEWLADTEGVEVYARPLTRPPIVRRTPEQVRRELMSAWIEHALLALHHATFAANRTSPRAGGASSNTDASAVSRAVAERAMAALLTARGCAATKAEPHGMLAQLAEADPDAAEAIRPLLAHTMDSATAARAVLGTAVVHLSRDPETAPYLERARRRLAEAMILLR